MVVLVMCNDVVVMVYEEEYLCVLVVVGKWLFVVEYDWLCGFWVLVFVEDLDVVLGGDE